MTPHTLRDAIQRLIQRELELPCRAAHTGPKYGDSPGIRVFAGGREFLVLVGARPTLGTPNPYEDALALLPGEVKQGRACTAEEIVELDRTEEW